MKITSDEGPAASGADALPPEDLPDGFGSIRTVPVPEEDGSVIHSQVKFGGIMARRPQVPADDKVIAGPAGETVTLKGILTWDGDERRSNRYGQITVDKQNYDESATAQVGISDPVRFAAMNGSKVAMSVKVVETRKSGHVGDLVRKIKPSTPEVDSVFDLGSGTLRCDAADWSPIGISFGIEPDDGRPHDWFDPKILYQLHDQTVQITIRRI